ncbi:AarF/ABC1/UbiB kinase family protein, partial [Pseudomonas canadensis]|uniref:AarF/ABC1/UbiB kinase family protein n=1 Tax=Pseudomonas canadensis TaxID=915099 RepID=UPI0030DDC2D0
MLKIRRPDIRPRMEADLRLIAELAALAETSSAEARRFRPRELVRQLAQAVLEELDFTSEGRNADRLRADFAQDPRVVIPEIHWQWTSETLLVMDFIEGVPPREAATLRAAGLEPAVIAALGADVVLDMVMINGRFHGDPHPGNLLCLPGNRIALLDLGMIGHVSPRRREEVIAFVQSL